MQEHLVERRVRPLRQRVDGRVAEIVGIGAGTRQDVRPRFVHPCSLRGGGTCLSEVTCADIAQSKARLLRAQYSLSTCTRCAVRLANSVTSTSMLNRLRPAICCRVRVLPASSGWYF